MYYAYKYRLTPSDAHREALDSHRDICRQLYNHALYRLNAYQDEHGETPAMTTLRAELPALKEWWDELNDVYSKVLQTVVERLFDNLEGLSKLKENGYVVGELKWKSPREYRSFTYHKAEAPPSRSAGLPAPAEAQVSRVGRKPTRWEPAAILLPAPSQL